MQEALNDPEDWGNDNELNYNRIKCEVHDSETKNKKFCC